MRRARHLVGEITEAKMTVLCAWCGVLLSPGGRRVSHGICSRCVRSFERDLEGMTSRTPGA